MPRPRVELGAERTQRDETVERTIDRVDNYMPHEFYELASDEYRTATNKYMRAKRRLKATKPTSRNVSRIARRSRAG